MATFATALDERADFTISLPVTTNMYDLRRDGFRKDETYVPNGKYEMPDADGNIPSVTLKVEGSTVGYALQVLSEITEEDILSAVYYHAFGDDYKIRVDRDPYAAAQKVTKFFFPFATFWMGISSAREYVELEITAPSGLIALKAFQFITSEEQLSAQGFPSLAQVAEYSI